MFEKNDYVIYGCSGVCKVMDISKMNMMGMDKNKLYYTLQPMNAKDSQIYTPIDNDRIIIRRIITREEAEQLIRDIPKTPQLGIEEDKLREEKFKEALKSCDCKELVRVIKTLYFRKQERQAQGKKVTATDEKYFKIAEENLFSELAIALKIDKNQVDQYIKDRIKQEEY